MDTSNSVMSRLAEWVKHPFKSDMSAIDWLLFLGLVMIGIFLWSRVMAHITE